MVSNRCKTFGDKLLELRNKKGYSQEAFAKMVKTSRQVVSNWEANKAQPSANKFTLISQVIGVKMEFMLDNERSLADITVDDFVDSNDIVCCDILRENEIQQELAKRNSANQQNIVVNSCSQCFDCKRSQKKKLTKKAKLTIAISVIAVALLLSIAFIIFDIATTPPDRQGQFSKPVRSHAWNFSAENIGWIIFSLAIAAGIIFGIVMLCKYLKVKKDNQKQIAENKDEITDIESNDEVTDIESNIVEAKE